MSLWFSSSLLPESVEDFLDSLLELIVADAVDVRVDAGVDNDQRHGNVVLWVQRKSIEGRSNLEDVEVCVAGQEQRRQKASSLDDVNLSFVETHTSFTRRIHCIHRVSVNRRSNAG